MEKRDITPAVVGGLVAEQSPQWADLPVERRGAAEIAELLEDAWREVASPELIAQLDAEKVLPLRSRPS